MKESDETDKMRDEVQQWLSHANIALILYAPHAFRHQLHTE
ncbi:hypothetical protein [Chitinophaga agri]|nr:hypothetical protein [Chitinophaga agri]